MKAKSKRLSHQSPVEAAAVQGEDSAPVQDAEESSGGGAPPDRIEWVADKVANLWLSYVNHFGPRAERFAFVAGLEAWKVRSET